jgi:dynein heavy chain
MPVMSVRGLAWDKVDVSTGIYVCPTYKTEQRGPTYVFCAQLKVRSEMGMGWGVF